MEDLYTSLNMLPNTGNRINVLCWLGTDSYGDLADGKIPGGGGTVVRGLYWTKSELYVE